MHCCINICISVPASLQVCLLIETNLILGCMFPIALHTGLGMSRMYCNKLMSTGLEPTSYAWLPHSLYVGCASGSVVIVDTATVLKSRQQAQRASYAGAVPGPALGPRLVEDVPGVATAEQASLPVVAALEYSGQMIYIEALAVNKDCVAVAGHCPIIRWAAKQFHLVYDCRGIALLA